MVSKSINNPLQNLDCYPGGHRTEGVLHSDSGKEVPQMDVSRARGEMSTSKDGVVGTMSWGNPRTFAVSVGAIS